MATMKGWEEQHRDRRGQAQLPCPSDADLISEHRKGHRRPDRPSSCQCEDEVDAIRGPDCGKERSYSDRRNQAGQGDIQEAADGR